MKWRGGGFQTRTSAELINDNLDESCPSDRSDRPGNHAAEVTMAGGAGDQGEATLAQSPAAPGGKDKEIHGRGTTWAQQFSELATPPADTGNALQWPDRLVEQDAL